MGCFAAIVTASLGFEFRKHPRKLGSGSAATNTHTQYCRSVLPDDRSKKGDIASFKGGKEHEVENLRRVEVIQSHDYDRKAKLREAAVAFMGRFQLHFSKVSSIVGNSLLRVAFPWEPRNPAGFDVSWAWASVLR